MQVTCWGMTGPPWAVDLLSGFVAEPRCSVLDRSDRVVAVGAAGDREDAAGAGRREVAGAVAVDHVLERELLPLPGGALRPRLVGGVGAVDLAICLAAGEQGRGEAADIGDVELAEAELAHGLGLVVVDERFAILGPADQVGVPELEIRHLGSQPLVVALGERLAHRVGKGLPAGVGELLAVAGAARPVGAELRPLLVPARDHRGAHVGFVEMVVGEAHRDRFSAERGCGGDCGRAVAMAWELATGGGRGSAPAPHPERAEGLRAGTKGPAGSNPRPKQLGTAPTGGRRGAGAVGCWNWYHNE